jgi:anti-sigma factor RsiW
MKDDLHCIELVARLGEYLEGAMSTEERHRFEVHMEHCIGCHRFFVQLRLLRKALSAAVETDADECSPRLSAIFSDWKKARETRPGS